MKADGRDDALVPAEGSFLKTVFNVELRTHEPRACVNAVLISDDCFDSTMSTSKGPNRLSSLPVAVDIIIKKNRNV